MLTRLSDFPRHPFANSFFGELHREMDRLFQGQGRRSFDMMNTGRFPRVNVYDKDDSLLVVAEVPGLRVEDLNLEANDKGFSLKGERKVEIPEDVKVHRTERSSYQFTKSFAWPVAVDVDSIEASLKDGMLQIKVAKAPEARPRSIEVKVS